MRLLGRRRDGRMRKLFRRRPEGGTMSLLEHLEELRNRLLWVIGAVGLAAIGGWMLFDDIVDRLIEPARPFLTDLSDGRLIFTGPAEAFTLRFKVSVYVGLAIAFPVVLWHLWRFVAPGLHRNEKKYAIPFIGVGMLLFLTGLMFAMFTMPQALEFLIGPVITGASIEPLLSARQYLDFALLYLVAFGLAFEFPVVLMALSLTRVITSRQMGAYRRHVFMGIALVTAFLTPSVDWITMTVLTVALYVLFEACIWLSKLLKR